MKFLKFAVAAALSVALVGCGNGPKAPEGTVAAAYIDLGKALDNVEDVIDDFLDELPSSMKEDREGMRKGIEEGKKFAKDQGLDLSGLDWAFAALMIDDNGRESMAYAIRVDKDMLKGIRDLLPNFSTTLNEKISEETVYDAMLPVGRLYVAVLDKGLVLAAEPERIYSWERDEATKRKETDLIAKLIATYKGDAKPAPGYKDIDDLEDNTIARVLAARLGDSYKRGFGKNAEQIAQMMAETIGDEDLYESVTGLGDVMLDINLDDDTFGIALSVEAASRSDAKIFEQYLEGLTAGDARFVLDGVMAFLANGPMRRDFRHNPELLKTFIAVKKLFKGAFDVDRSWATCTLEIELDTADVIEAAVKNLFPAPAK